MRGQIIYKKGEGPPVYCIDGNEVTKEEFDLAFPYKPLEGKAPGGQHPAGWPFKSDALAVHPKQIPEAMARDRAHGIETEYDPEDGRAIMKDPGHRRAMMKSLGYHDNDGNDG
jgi:hypothetical protein